LYLGLAKATAGKELLPQLLLSFHSREPNCFPKRGQEILALPQTPKGGLVAFTTEPMLAFLTPLNPGEGPAHYCIPTMALLLQLFSTYLFSTVRLSLH
jgi:hypothetical protein